MTNPSSKGNNSPVDPNSANQNSSVTPNEQSRALNLSGAISKPTLEVHHSKTARIIPWICGLFFISVLVGSSIVYQKKKDLRIKEAEQRRVIQEREDARVQKIMAAREKAALFEKENPSEQTDLSVEKGSDESSATTFLQSSSSKAIEASKNVLVARNSMWTYFDEGEDLGDSSIVSGVEKYSRRNWKHLKFNDKLWLEGQGILGYGNLGRYKIRTTTGYGLNPEEKIITTYLRHKFVAENISDFKSIEGRILKKYGAVIYLNGTEVCRRNMPEGLVDFETQALTFAGESDGSPYTLFSINPANLVDGLNVVAAEIHQDDPTSASIGFDLELVGIVDTPNLLVNGDFETDGFSSWTDAANVLTQPSRGQIAAAQSGASFAILDSNDPGRFHQTIATERGRSYRLSFYIARPHTRNTNFKVNIDVFSSLEDVDGSGDGDLLDETISDGSVPGEGVWTPFVYEFTATTDQSTLRFGDPGSVSIDVAIDTVLIETISNLQ